MQDKSFSKPTELNDKPVSYLAYFFERNLKCLN